MKPICFCVPQKHLEKERAGAAALPGSSGAEVVDLSGAGPSGVVAAASGRLLEPTVNQAHLQQVSPSLVSECWYVIMCVFSTSGL